MAVFIIYPVIIASSPCWIAKSRRWRQRSFKSLVYVSWTRSSTKERERSSHSEAVRIMVRPMGLLTRESNSSHASLSRESAQRQTSSFSDKAEYCDRVHLVSVGKIAHAMRTAPR